MGSPCVRWHPGYLNSLDQWFVVNQPNATGRDICKMLFIYNRILLIFSLNALSNSALHAFLVYFTHVLFYTPVWKTGRIMPWQCPSVRLSVRLSVRPSVRPCFPDFSSTCFEISIWNLVYTFSRWHDMSSLSCITIGSLWPSLQPKVGQTYFLQSRLHKSR